MVLCGPFMLGTGLDSSVDVANGAQTLALLASYSFFPLPVLFNPLFAQDRLRGYEFQFNLS